MPHPSNTTCALMPDYPNPLTPTIGGWSSPGVPFGPVARKFRDNHPQKAQENRFHQCRNLDGVFAIDGPMPSGPVLLVDDVVDSGWTLTVVAALLRQAGSGPVWPLALATSYSGT